MEELPVSTDASTPSASLKVEMEGVSHNLTSVQTTAPSFLTDIPEDFVTDIEWAEHLCALQTETLPTSSTAVLSDATIASSSCSEAEMDIAQPANTVLEDGSKTSGMSACGNAANHTANGQAGGKQKRHRQGRKGQVRTSDALYAFRDQWASAAKLQARGLKSIGSMCRNNTVLLAKWEKQRAQEIQQFNALVMSVHASNQWADQLHRLNDQVEAYKSALDGSNAELRERDDYILDLQQQLQFAEGNLQMFRMKDADNKAILDQAQAELVEANESWNKSKAECKELRAKVAQLEQQLHSGAGLHADEQGRRQSGQGQSEDEHHHDNKELASSGSSSSSHHGNFEQLSRELRREFAANVGAGRAKEVDKLIQKSTKYLKQWKEDHNKVLKEKETQLVLLQQRCRRLEADLRVFEEAVNKEKASGGPGSGAGAAALATVQQALSARAGSGSGTQHGQHALVSYGSGDTYGSTGGSGLRSSTSMRVGPRSLPPPGSVTSFTKSLTMGRQNLSMSPSVEDEVEDLTALLTDEVNSDAMEIDSVGHQQSLQAELETARARLELLQSELTDTQGKLSNSQADLAKAQDEIQRLSTELQQATLRSQNAAAAGNAAAQDEVNHAQAQLSQAQTELETSRSECSRHAAALAQSQAEINTLKAQFEDIQSEWEGKLSTSKADLATARDEVNKLRSQLSEAARRTVDPSDQSGVDPQQLVALQSQLQALQEDLARSVVEKGHIQDDLDTEREMHNGILQELQQMKQRHAEMQRKQGELQREVEALSGLKASSEADLQDSQARAESAELAFQQANAQLDQINIQVGIKEREVEEARQALASAQEEIERLKRQVTRSVSIQKRSSVASEEAGLDRRSMEAGTPPIAKRLSSHAASSNNLIGTAASAAAAGAANTPSQGATEQMDTAGTSGTIVEGQEASASGALPRQNREEVLLLQSQIAALQQELEATQQKLQEFLAAAKSAVEEQQAAAGNAEKPDPEKSAALATLAGLLKDTELSFCMADAADTEKTAMCRIRLLQGHLENILLGMLDTTDSGAADGATKDRSTGSLWQRVKDACTTTGLPLPLQTPAFAGGPPAQVLPTHHQRPSFDLSTPHLQQQQEQLQQQPYTPFVAGMGTSPGQTMYAVTSNAGSSPGMTGGYMPGAADLPYGAGSSSSPPGGYDDMQAMIGNGYNTASPMDEDLLGLGYDEPVLAEASFTSGLGGGGGASMRRPQPVFEDDLLGGFKEDEWALPTFEPPPDLS